jgi:hypothetical protein
VAQVGDSIERMSDDEGAPVTRRRVRDGEADVVTLHSNSGLRWRRRKCTCM